MGDAARPLGDAYAVPRKDDKEETWLMRLKRQDFGTKGED